MYVYWKTGHSGVEELRMAEKWSDPNTCLHLSKLQYIELRIVTIFVRTGEKSGHTLQTNVRKFLEVLITGFRGWDQLAMTQLDLYRFLAPTIASRQEVFWHDIKVSEMVITEAQMSVLTVLWDSKLWALAFSHYPVLLISLMHTSANYYSQS